ncbi:MAG: pentapeptide repeat-containing protein [Cyanobacteria bacterium P01_A01_bin.40]
MADEKHLEILRKGVEVWNKWRKEYPDIRPRFHRVNLSGVNLFQADLSSTDLIGANLSAANLSGSNLIGADLSDANLVNTNFSGADLSDANLVNTNFSGANLIGTSLNRAVLFFADFSGANLSYASLKRAKSSNVNFIGAVLSGTNLIEAHLRKANLSHSILIRADLSGSDLNHADLSYADLSSSDLNHADLSSANLRGVRALAANFEGATLTEASIEDWNINSKTNLQNVSCNCIYIKCTYLKKTKKCFFENRIPHDSNKIFALGEFTKRYQKILETVELYFGDGIDWQVFLASFQKLQEEEKLKVEDGDRALCVVQTIENTGDGSFVIKVGVSPDTDKGEYEKSFWQKYQPMLVAKEEQIKFFREELQTKRKENTRLIGIIETMAEKESSKFTFHNPSFTGGVSDKFEGIHLGGDIHNYAPEHKQSFAEAAAEIQQLLDQLQETHGITLESAQQQVAKDLTTIAQNDPKLKDRFITLGKFIGENSAKTLISEGVKGAITLFLMMI